MSLKIYFKSYKIEKLEALIRRIDSNHPAKSRTEKRLATSKAGERSLDYHLSFLEDYGHGIFQGLRLSSGKFHFQIDILLTHPNFFVIPK
ncbi:nuclease-related domain-containing protein [Pseudalkalibacillus sp. A8]|uniref:nuclease-related domain-containing protein n=1 Tax=Pseudalkalibacillus sp. A8 TaxID=3382641 RepID=UPI0038B621CB